MTAKERTTLLLTDNEATFPVARDLRDRFGGIEIAQSPGGRLPLPEVDVRLGEKDIVLRHSLVLSLHCRQIFPRSLVEAVRCVNVHPGLTPWNRGWFPHVFSIINHLPAGVTIHEMDHRLDHGPIIVQREYRITPWDTSGSAYAALLEIERELLVEYYPSILDGSYQTTPPYCEGNLNRRSDFEALRELDLARTGPFGDFLDRLRALSHPGYRNAFFRDEKGRRVYVSVVLEPEEGGE